MVKITKVYTKTGDTGKTSLAAGKKLAKTTAHIAAIGSIDELNSSLGVVVALLQQQSIMHKLKQQLIRIQNSLYDLGASLAVLPTDRRDDTPKVYETDVKTLEQEIDDMNATLPRLHSFVLPGGNLVTAQLHVARTVCRRTELALLRMGKTDMFGNIEKSYINRLSDWLFVAARFAGKQTGADETLWQPGKRDF